MEFLLLEKLAAWNEFYAQAIEARVPFEVQEVRIATTLAAAFLGIVSLKRAIRHKRLRQYDFTAAYIGTFTAMLVYVFASSYLSWASFGKGISTVREAMYIVYHLLTMMAWFLWFVALAKRGVNGARPEGR